MKYSETIIINFDKYPYPEDELYKTLIQRLITKMSHEELKSIFKYTKPKITEEEINGTNPFKDYHRQIVKGEKRENLTKYEVSINI